MAESRTQLPTKREALAYWFKLGWISFGGPAGQIALMHREVVERRKWIGEAHFLHALNFCMLLPGPEAQQLATYLGWRLHGWRGGVAAGTLFVLPSVFILYALSWLYVHGGEVKWLASLFHGLMPAVIAVVAAALLRIGKRALQTGFHWVLAAASSVGIFFFQVSFVWILAGAASLAWARDRWIGRRLPVKTELRVSPPPEGSEEALVLPPASPPTAGRTWAVIGLGGLLWLAPVVAVGLWLGWSSTLARQGVFFSQTALITFGGAYAVLPYVAQQAVERFGWLSHGQMMSGLALAETTPGPLIMVLQFVGFVGGWQNPGTLEPWQAATLGALLTTWTTFVPGFVFILLGGPYVEHLQTRPGISAAMAGITAAVVGVIGNLTIWFAWHACWPAGWQPGLTFGGMDWLVIALSALAFVALRRQWLGEMAVIGICAILGVLWGWIGRGGWTLS